LHSINALSILSVKRSTARFFLGIVNQRFKDEPLVISEFNKILKAINDKELTPSESYPQVCELFKGHLDVIQEYVLFMPEALSENTILSPMKPSVPTSSASTAPSSIAPAPASEYWSFLSSNPAKAGGERFFLLYAVAWIGLMVVIVGTRAFESFTPEHYMAVGINIFVPCVLWPIIFPPASEAHLPLVERYTFKNNVWIFIVTFYALWVWQIYFYKVLCTNYTFSIDQYRINNVPICLFMITQGYFSMYHAVSDAVLRAFWRRFPQTSARVCVVFVFYLLGFSCLLAFAETFTIQNFEHYQIIDRNAMYIYGSVFYALYFVFTFPMHLTFDEDAAQPWSLWQVVCNAFAASGMVTIALELWRVAIGSIVPNCPLPEAAGCTVLPSM
jgi:cycloeucalenol cycloisomerase